MYGYVYLTTNLVNQKKYIGQHKSSVFDKKYKGTGKLIKQAISKYGWENFETIILEECETPEELNEAEKRIIKEYNAVYSDDYYNIAYGGINSMAHPLSEEEKIQRGRVSKEVWQRTEYREKMSTILHELQADGKSWMVGKHHSEETKRKMSESRSGEKHPMYGKKHSEESRRKMSDSAKKREHPPTSIGYVWIHTDSISKTVPKEDLDKYLAEGFIIGRLPVKKKKVCATTIESIGNEKDIAE